MSPTKKFFEFASVEATPAAPEDALFHLIPAPYEKTVSYGTGAANGPAAILEASLHLEVFDGLDIPSDKGIFTREPLSCAGTHEDALGEIEKAVGETLALGKIPILLGGEHTATLGALRAVKQRNPEFGVVQFDAHADLRDSYTGTPYSHGCVMRRAMEMGARIFQVGVRSLSYEEHVFRSRSGVVWVDAIHVATSGLPQPLLPEDFPKKIYVTIDVDALDPSLMPSTGTPEPGGLTWYQLMSALESTVVGRRVIGFDVVELAPIKGLHAPDFAAARLIYNFMGMLARHGHGYQNRKQ